MIEANSNETKTKNDGGKRHIHINFGLLAGLFCGAILGIFIGSIANDVPLYTGFGMLLGMAISFDITAHIKHKEKQSTENDETRA